MEQVYIDRIGRARRELAELVEDIEPRSEAEWDAFDQLCTAHKAIRKIDTGKLGQLPLPETPAIFCHYKTSRDWPDCYEDCEQAGTPDCPHMQLPLPEGAAVQGGEGSLVDKTDLALVQTSEDEWNTIRSVARGEELITGIPPRKARKHVNASA